MQRIGVIGDYAIGGAVGASFYLEPAATVDLDIFVVLPESVGLVSLSAIYEYAEKQNWRLDREHIVVGDWPVQFLPVSHSLEREAVAEAVEARLDDVVARVMTAEHLAAIALRTGRAKDHARVVQFNEEGVLERQRLSSILAHHNLQEEWDNFSKRYLNE